jgi:hypothetical protein
LGTVAHGYQVERDLERLIEKRHEGRVATEGERREQELWMESEQRYWERVSRQQLWERLRYHDRIIAAHSSTYELLVDRHRQEVARLEEMLGITEAIEGEEA